MIPYVNIHTHQTGQGIVILDVGEEYMTPGFIPASTTTGAICFFSAGIHPMKIQHPEEHLSRLKQIIGRDEFVALGECGLDRRSPETMSVQYETFTSLVQLAEHHHKPLIIHCVKAYSDLIAIYKQTRSSVPWIIHGFNNNARILEQLLSHGYYISIGSALLNASSNARTLLTRIPSDRLFLETDDKETDIRDIYEAASVSLKIELDRLKSQLLENFVRIFKNATT